MDQKYNLIYNKKKIICGQILYVLLKMVQILNPLLVDITPARMDVSMADSSACAEEILKEFTFYESGSLFLWLINWT